MGVDNSIERMDWAGFLGRPAVTRDAGLAASVVSGRAVLITGAGGSIGSGLAAMALAGDPSILVLLDLSEGALYELIRRLSAEPDLGKCKIVAVTGDVGEERFLAHLLRRYRPELILHAAAYKHVPFMEQNPLSAIANNAIASYRLAAAAATAGVERLVAVSTDKAVHPSSIMGASKRIGELAVLALAGPGSRMNAVRLCNVLGSSGSVAPIFLEQARAGLPLTVTHAEAQRYFLTPAEAERAIFRAAGSDATGRILVPDCGRAQAIVRLAGYVAAHAAGEREETARIEFVGLRPGDKLSEELLASGEVIESRSEDGMRVVLSPVPEANEVARMVRGLEAAIDNYHGGEGDLSGVMSLVGELVPGYQWSRTKTEETRAEAP